MVDATSMSSHTGTAEAVCHHGLVLSGGGAKGAYEVGVLKALFEGTSPATRCQPIDCGIFTGTSVGNYNATYLASRDDTSELQALHDLETIWRSYIANTQHSCGNGVFRIRGAPFQFFDPGCLFHPVQNVQDLIRDAGVLGRYFFAEGVKFTTSQESLETRWLHSLDIGAFVSVEPLKKLIEDTIDLRNLSRSSKRLAVVASDFRQGTPRVFRKRDIERHGSKVIQASAAIPGLFPPVEIDDTPFVDGGVTMNTPLKPAIADGADILHVIFVDPQIQDIPFPKLPSTIDTVYRLYVILIAGRVNSDLAQAQAINDQIMFLDELKSQAPGLVTGGAAGRWFGRMQHRHQQGRPYRPLEIHRYRPKSDLGGAEGLLDFSIDAIDRNIGLGYQDALTHDCEAEGCVRISQPVIPGAAGSHPAPSQ